MLFSPLIWHSELLLVQTQPVLFFFFIFSAAQITEEKKDFLMYPDVEQQVKNIFPQLPEMNSVLVAIQLHKGGAQNLTCIRSFRKQPIQWIKNGKEYTDKVYSNSRSSVLPLRGNVGEVGNYACQWNNSLGEIKFREFNVTFEDSGARSNDTIILAVTLVILLLITVFIGVKLYSNKKEQTCSESKALLRNMKEMSRELLREDESEQLPPYDKQWEFPRHRLKLGSQLGVGCFGRVVKAEAVGIKGADEIVKTVAVKMTRTQTNVAALQDLVTELKVLIHLGSHLNVLNLLGACTKKINKGELLVIVEYCRFGNLQSYLTIHRNLFRNQVDEFGHLTKNSTLKEDRRVEEGLEGSLVPIDKNSTTNISDCPIHSAHYTQELALLWNYQPDAENAWSPTFSTQDLISWSFQIARGMDYLASKKVLHGDLAARNVLLADNGIVKVSDFGMARRMYYEGNYEKKGQGLMPIKWMAPESLTDRILSTESDVWSYGIVLWELFSLGKVPYPGIDAKQLIRELENGYRMEKPNNAPNFIGEIMVDCWKTEPKERPTFGQLEQTICVNMESSVTTYYCNLNEPYEKLNQDDKVQSQTELFGLEKLLYNKPRLEKSRSKIMGQVGERYSQIPQSFTGQ